MMKLVVDGVEVAVLGQREADLPDTVLLRVEQHDFHQPARAVPAGALSCMARLCPPVIPQALGRGARLCPPGIPQDRGWCEGSGGAPINSLFPWPRTVTNTAR